LFNCSPTKYVTFFPAKSDFESKEKYSLQKS
jgi:hypothetical protein